ncbi:lysozyme [Phenylobacterium sp. SCN 70-31]|uniref:lysozyme n=1 Tax=Phenylobacterium sp. SCN 70-31 TaxID=1660129 RepID=UPI00086A65BA|nr:lysozyme [Phenylobacterium sp. SCN 70-31]ODT86702.1 MAG: hypothetical protein ABS78_15585 [Phenylobacterium sp. SCN 70-31]
MSRVRVLAGVLAASSVAVGTIAAFEGYVPVGYPDPALGVNLPTACYGSTRGVVLGKRYTEQECVGMLADDVVKHGLDIAPCLPETLPLETHAAFVSFGFNVGATKFCASTLSRKARSGDLPGACAELSKWVYAGGQKMRGLVNRRAAERKLCMEGLA